MLLFWLSEDDSSEIGLAPCTALAVASDVRAILERELEDYSTAGRIPRAIMGRYLTWLNYYGEDWLKDWIPALLPASSKALRDAAWISHLESDEQPLAALMPQLQQCYANEIANLAVDEASPGRGIRNDRLAEYLVLQYIWESLPEELFEQFWRSAPQSVLRKAMLFLGKILAQLPDESHPHSARARSYWNCRLEAAISSTDRDKYRSELGTIGVWYTMGVEPLWVTDQLLLMLSGGFAPKHETGVIEKLVEIAQTHIDLGVKVLRRMVENPHVDHWIYAVQNKSIRVILVEGKQSGSIETRASINEIISILASKGETGFMDLFDGNA